MSDQQPSKDTEKAKGNHENKELANSNTSKEDKVDFPQPLVPHNSTVTDSFLSRILHGENI